MRTMQTFARADAGSTEPGSPSVFVASTSEVARDGDIIEGPWKLDGYRANPVILWAHDQSQAPIGRGMVTEEDGQLRVSVTWDEEDPEAARIAGKVRRGMLSAVSVSWRPESMTPLRSLPRDDSRYRESGYLHRGPELLEISVVPVPADPRAIVTQRADEDPPADPIAELTARIAALEEQVDTLRTALALREAEADPEPEGEDLPPDEPSEEDPIPRAWREAGWASEVEREAETLAAWRAQGWPV